MSSAAAVEFGKVIFNVLKDSSNITSIPGMGSVKIQPAPMKAQADPSIGILYEISAVNPINAKRELRGEDTPLFIVDFSIQAFSTDYSTSITLAKTIVEVFHDLAPGTYEGIVVDGIKLQTITEGYNKAQRYYNKSISLQGRILL
tara:strand:+ start:2960 stop:3394 length:435 start_codon:yes stop_codon:yes gene_type:complete